MAVSSRRSAPTPPPTPLAKRLRWVLETRADEFSSERALSTKAGLAPGYVSLYLSGERGSEGITTRSAQKLADATGYAPAWFLDGSSPPAGYPGDDAPMRRDTPSGLRFNNKMAAGLALLGQDRVHPNAIAAGVALAESGVGLDWDEDQWAEKFKELDAKARRHAVWNPSAAE